MSLFGTFPVDTEDGESILEEWKENLVKMGYPDMGDDDVDSCAPLFLNVCNSMMDSMMLYLMSKKNKEFDKSYFNDVVRRCFKENGVTL